MGVRSTKSHDNDIGREFLCRGDDNDSHQSDNEDEDENRIEGNKR